jgi:hypothetical protein
MGSPLHNDTPKRRLKILAEGKRFDSPINFRRSIERLLEGIPAKYLAGLDCVVLRDTSGFSQYEKKRSEHDRTKVLTGAYYRRARKTPPRIHLFVDNIVGRNSFWLRMALIRELLLAGPLFHELGHHIQESIIPEHKDKEATAEAWSQRLTREYFQSHYRYTLPMLRVLRAIIKIIRK